MEVLWKKFNALGTEIIISAYLNPDQKNILEEAEKIILNFNNRFSRFLNDNELYKFNNFSGEEFKASDMMADLLRESKKLYLETSGAFDPTVIGSLEAVGYDKSFEKIGEGVDGKSGVDVIKIREDFLKRPRMSELIISGNKIIKPKGFRVDFGGMGKGYIVDFLADNLFSGIKNFWISAGGDLVVKGEDQNKKGWIIGVQNPIEPEKEIFSIKTKNGEKLAVATSGVFKRAGKKGDYNWHHIIDPRSGFPVENNILAVTVISSNAKRADVFAKAVLILGEKEGVDFIESQKDSACIIFFKDGGLKMSKDAIKYF